MDEEITAAWILASMKNPNLRHELRKTENNIGSSRLNPPARTEPEPRDLPPVPRLRRLIGQWSQPCEKKLTSSDTNANLGRLLLPTEFCKKAFLLPLLEKDEDLGVGIPVTVYDLNGVEYKMSFKFWASKYYVLTQGWTAFFRVNELDSEDDVKLWMFRHVVTGGAGRLCFFISFVKNLKMTNK